MAAFPKVGEIFDDRFKIIAVLGRGGLGTVFKAIQLDTDRTVALKVLHRIEEEEEEEEEEEDHSETQARFLREGQSLSKLQHENVVAVYRMGISSSGFRYIAMELINGTSLRSFLNEKQKLDKQAICEILIQCAKALEAVHALGLIHRDIKPENIMLIANTDGYHAKIIDFGFARKSLVSETQKLTATGVLVGTASYMSPEQAAGRQLDSRSDVYALGVCLFEMLSGAPPFTADTSVGVLYKHKHERIPKLPSNSANKFLAKALAKNPAQRFQSMKEMQEALLQLASAGGDSKEPKRILLVSAAAILLALMARPYFIARRTDKASHNPSSISASRKDASEQYKSCISEAISLREKGAFAQAASKMAEAQSIIVQVKSQSINQDYIEILRGECLLASKQYEECLKALDRLATKPVKETDSDIKSCRVAGPFTPAPKSSPQNILDAKEMSAECLLNLGRVNEARKMMAPLIEWQAGLLQSLANAIRTLIKMREFDSVKKIIQHTHKPALLAVARQTCQEEGHPELFSRQSAQ